MTSIPLIDIIGMAGAVLTTLCWLPQALKVIRERETRVLSLLATAGFAAGVGLWLVYGVAIGNWPGKRRRRIHPAESEAAATSPAWQTIPVDSGETAPTCLRSTSKSSVTGCGSAMATGL
jgi:MtN3 and saliva related transmembrane protein